MQSRKFTLIIIALSSLIVGLQAHLGNVLIEHMPVYCITRSIFFNECLVDQNNYDARERLVLLMSFTTLHLKHLSNFILF
uniref:Secreted protein n=1 Tax=Romanomermis culicivorax TaxID=13658 RepID=A0A915JRL0_ROMCU